MESCLLKMNKVSKQELEETRAEVARLESAEIQKQANKRALRKANQVAKELGLPP